MSAQPEDYSVSPVSGRVSEELRREEAAVWLRHGAIPDASEARRRADELVCVARNAAGEIVGVNTVYVSRLRAAEDRYFFYRMFIRPRDRHLHLCIALVRAAVDALRERRVSGSVVKGVVLITENPKLMRDSGRRLLTHLGWRHAGADPRGLDIWRIDFE